MLDKDTHVVVVGFTDPRGYVPDFREDMTLGESTDYIKAQVQSEEFAGRMLLVTVYLEDIRTILYDYGFGKIYMRDQFKEELGWLIPSFAFPLHDE